MSLAGLKKQFNKANQYMNEKIGSAEKTTISDEYVVMEKAIDATGIAVDDIMTKTNEFLQPNPVTRAKLSTAKTMNKMRGQSSNNRYPQVEGMLGECFLKHAGELGDDSYFGIALRDCGDSMKQLSDVKDALDYSVSQNFIEPLEHLKNKELKEINHHRKKMESRRLDYDGKKRKQAKGGSNITEDEIALAEEKFQESLELAECGMRNLLESDVEQIRQLQAFADAQVEFHQQAVDIIKRLQETLEERISEAESRPKKEYKPVEKSSSFYDSYTESRNNGNDNNFGSFSQADVSTPSPSESTRQCRALYDFEPETEGELEFGEGDIIMKISEIDENWLEGEIKGKRGYFPMNYVEFVD